MKQKLLFIKMIWLAIIGKSKAKGYVWFYLDDKQQKDFLTGKSTIDFKIKYFGVDKQVIEKLVKRIERKK